MHLFNMLIFLKEVKVEDIQKMKDIAQAMSQATMYPGQTVPNPVMSIFAIEDELRNTLLTNAVLQGK